MGLFGDRYVGEFEGHTIELLRNNWTKTLKLFIDGEEAAGDTCHLPVAITLTATLENDGVAHEVVARAIPHSVIFTRDTIEIDGQELPLRAEDAKGNTPVWAMVLIGLSGVAALAGVGVLLTKVWR